MIDWRRAWRTFCARRLTVASALFLLAFSFFSFTAEIWSNSKPIVLCFHGRMYFPIFADYPPREFGVRTLVVMNYKQLHLDRGDWAVWPVNHWDPYESNKTAFEYPAPPSSHNWLGTDDRGRDIFARILYGFRSSLVFSLAVWFFSSVVALLYGGLSGYIGGKLDLYGQRVVELLSTVPQLLLLIFILSIFTPSMALLICVNCAFGWIMLSQFVRAEALRTRHIDYAEAARSLGAGHFHVFFRHILPNSLIPLITFAPFTIIANISALAALDYLGLGLQPPTPSWGELLREAEAYFTWAWWIPAFTSLSLFFTLLALTLVGDGVREALNPS